MAAENASQGSAELIRRVTDGLLEGVNTGECAEEMAPMISYANDLVRCGLGTADEGAHDGAIDYPSFLVGASFANAVRELPRDGSAEERSPSFAQTRRSLAAAFLEAAKLARTLAGFAVRVRG